MKTILITNDPSIAADAQFAGVTRIMVDLESQGKKERQASRNTFISSHSWEDVGKIRAVLSTSQLIVRINPWSEGSPADIDRALAAGADIIMLPMITQMSQVERFVSYIAGRALVLPLVETSYSMAHIRDIAENPAIDELYIGLNDLHLSLGLDFLFEPLGNGLIEWMASHIQSCHKSFGFGGIATLDGGELPGMSILAEHVRLGSSGVILSSRFGKDIDIGKAEGRRERLRAAVQKLQSASQELALRSPEQQRQDAIATREKIKVLARAAHARQMSS